MKLPIGISDYKELREGNFYYIDKTLLIDELFHTAGKVFLITRPRRFGKTLNLSMLHYFFEITHESNAQLFKDTAIWEQEKYQSIQGTFPVIFLTFKNCKSKNWEKMYADMQDVIADEFKRHFDVLTPSLKEYDLEDYHAIVKRTASPSLYGKSLFFLSSLLRKQFKKPVIILIDEYDAPIHASYTYGYYENMMEFMRFFLTAVLKDNNNLQRAVLTGILRTAKESIFSGLNNLTVKTLLDDTFSDKFGFTIAETDQLLARTKLTKKSNEIKEWYNGYQCGKTTMYNPWSLLECVSSHGELAPYWSNTSDNELIKKLIAQADDTAKDELDVLLHNSSIQKEIKDDLIFPGITNNSEAVFSLLLFAGYMTFTNTQQIGGKTVCTLKIPNKEIKLLYHDLIATIFKESLGNTRMRNLKESLLQADGKLFGEILQEFTLQSMSMFDLPKNEPVRSYHLFALGLLVTLSDIFEVKSNRESGVGRYDILLIPYDKKGWGIILEFKKVSSESEENMEKMAQEALIQIRTKNYAQELKDHGVQKIAAFGIACKNKKTVVISCNL